MSRNDQGRRLCAGCGAPGCGCTPDVIKAELEKDRAEDSDRTTETTEERSYAFVDGQIVISVNVDVCAPIREDVVARHELLAILRAPYGDGDVDSDLNEQFAELGYTAKEELRRVTHPFWENYDDLRFAQVLFGTAARQWGGGPWWRTPACWSLPPTRHRPRPVATRAQFMDAIRKWTAPALDAQLSDWVRAGESALILDARTLRDICQHIADNAP